MSTCVVDSSLPNKHGACRQKTVLIMPYIVDSSLPNNYGEIAKTVQLSTKIRELPALGKFLRKKGGEGSVHLYTPLIIYMYIYRQTDRYTLLPRATGLCACPCGCPRRQKTGVHWTPLKMGYFSTTRCGEVLTAGRNSVPTKANVRACLG